MKKGQIILGAIALVVTAGSTLAFKAANKFGTHHKVFAQATSVCATCTTIWTNLAGTANRTNCLTKNGGTVAGTGSAQRTFYTVQNISKTVCSHPVNKITTVQ